MGARPAVWVSLFALLVTQNARAQTAIAGDGTATLVAGTQGSIIGTTTPLKYERHFGDAGEAVIASAFAISIGRLGYTDSDAASFSFEFDPSYDEFVWNNVSIGGSVILHYTQSSMTVGMGQGSQAIQSETNAYGGAVHVGYNQALSDSFSIWPRSYLGVWRQNVTQTPEGVGLSSSRDGMFVPFGDYRETSVWFQLYAPLLLHPAQHFFVGFGPSVLLDLSHSIATIGNRRIHFGASSTLGGWF